MKKVFLVSFFLSFLLSKFIGAAESKLWGIEISGNIDTVAGWQHDDENALGTAVGGPMGFFRIPNATAPGRDTFNFYIDQAEIDLNKSFGENLRIRVDLDFGRYASGSWRNTDSGFTGSNFELEQGYVTANISGIEFLVGRFSVPIGYYAVDRANNPTLSFSTLYTYLTPTNDTGMKFYEDFKEGLIDWDVYLIGSLAGSAPFGFAVPRGTTPNPGGINNYSDIPSYGTRLGFNWGKKDQESTLGISYAGGPERFGCDGGNASCNRHLTHIFDLDFAVKFTPQFLFAGEGIYRQDNSNLPGVRNDRAFGGSFVLNYDFSEKWRIFFRYGFMQDRTGYYTGVAENIYDVALGGGYQITETTKLKFEYSPEIFDPRAAGRAISLSNGFGVEFAYDF